MFVFFWKKYIYGRNRKKWNYRVMVLKGFLRYGNFWQTFGLPFRDFCWEFLVYHFEDFWWGFLSGFCLGFLGIAF